MFPSLRGKGTGATAAGVHGFADSALFLCRSNDSVEKTSARKPTARLRAVDARLLTAEALERERSEPKGHSAVCDGDQQSCTAL